MVVEYKYDAWGNAISITGSLASSVGSANPFRYRGYYFDTETGLYYVGSRYYDPEIGRFISPDLPEMMLLSDNIIGTNLYAYCYNNPVMYADHTGYLAANVMKLVNGLSASAIFASYATALYTSFAATLTKIGLYVTGVLAPKIAALFWWQPWLVAGIVVAAVAIVVATVMIVHNQTIAKADAKIKSTVKKGLSTQYWSANLGKGCVDIGRPLTYAQALAEVKAGRSVFTVTKALAYALAVAAGGAIHDNKHKNATGYYHHYHVNRTNPAHIWYLF